MMTVIAIFRALEAFVIDLRGKLKKPNLWQIAVLGYIKLHCKDRQELLRGNREPRIQVYLKIYSIFRNIALV